MGADMERPDIERILDACDRALTAGTPVDLAALGFWRAVAAVKRSPALVDAYAGRVGDIDRRAFCRGVRMRLPAAAGAAFVVAGTLAGLALLAAAPGVAHPWLELVLLAGFGALDVATHGLAHLAVGTLAGIRFTDWFVVLPSKPQPGLKTDYATYLRASARARAWMHASGALTTKLVPFLVLPYALAIGAAPWLVALLVAAGVAQIATDLLFSVRSSDWKKFRREMRVARLADSADRRSGVH